ncbi:hypothetical protein, partial [Rhodovulum sulfidophilum]|uniref:hypothetical protein n=1 Tax=Rhodovulum sulfidophilum TaxID=35806 RepID=UPI001F2B97F6
AIIKYIDERHQTVGHWIGHVSLPSPADDELCPRRVRERTMRLIRLIRGDHTSEEVRSVYEMIKSNADSMDFLNYASGKDCIANRLIVRMRRVFGYMRDGQIKVLLARYMSSSVDPYLEKRLKLICTK